MQITRIFEEITGEDVALAGGKGASLGEMTRAGIPVPEGFVVVAPVFEQFMKETKLSDDIDAILDTVKPDEVRTTQKASKQIQSLIMGKDIPKRISEEIMNAYEALGTDFVAVRSSATAEDSTSAAWAGQLDTFLNTTKESVLENIKKCWASLFTPRAILYSFEQGLDKESVSVALVIQKMVASESSGIAFSVHPVTEDPNQLIIEAGYGLGEAIVSGQFTPDSYVIDKENLNIIKNTMHEQKKGLFRKAGGGSEWKELGNKENKQVLTEEEIIELSKLVLKIEEHYGFPCDIEWARENGKFYITQSRPITTLRKDAIKDQESAKPSKENKNLFGLWDEYNPRTITPLEYDLYTKDVWQASLDMLDFGKGVPHIEDVVVTKGEVPIQIDPSQYKHKHIAPKKASNLFEEVTKWRARVQKLRRNIGDISGLDDSKLLRFIGLVSEQYKDMTRSRMLNMHMWIDTTNEVKKFFGELGLEFDEEQLTSGLETETSRMNEELRRLARLKKENASNFSEEFDLFIKKFSHFESDSVSVEDTKKTLSKYIENLSMSEITNKLANARHRFEAYKSRLLKNCKEKEKLENSITQLRNAVTLREDSKTLQDTAKPLLRQLLLELGKRFVDKKLLEKESQIYLLKWNEVKNYQANLELARKREKILEEKQNTSWLPDFFSGNKNFNTKILEGVSGSKGIISGKVKIIKSLQEFNKVKKGDIVVTYATNPLWTQLFGLISGIVVEHGTILSHAAITAREYGIPCVLGIRDATKMLKDGDLIEVDADAGVVKIQG